MSRIIFLYPVLTVGKIFGTEKIRNLSTGVENSYVNRKRKKVAFQMGKGSVEKSVENVEK